MLQLIDEKTKEIVKIGDRFMDFRKEEIYEVTRIQEPTHVGSTGRVYCKKVIRGGLDEFESSFFPGVLGLAWKEKKDEKNSNYIVLWAEDFDVETWENYCNITNSPYVSDHIKIWFNDDAVESYEGSNDEESEDLSYEN